MVSHSLFPGQEAEHAWPGRLLLPAPPTAVVPVDWSYHVSQAWEKKGVSSPRNPPPSTEKTGPPSQGSQTSNPRAFWTTEPLLHTLKAKERYRICWLCNEIQFLSSPVDPYSPLVSSAGVQQGHLGKVQPATSSRPCSLAAVYYFTCCAGVRNCDTML